MVDENNLISELKKQLQRYSDHVAAIEEQLAKQSEIIAELRKELTRLRYYHGSDNR